MVSKITETAVRTMAGSSLYDSEITGFLVRARKTGKFFSFEYRSVETGNIRRISLGKHGSITVEQARKAAKQHYGTLALGHDPLEIKATKKAQSTRQQQSTLRAFLDKGFKEATPEKNYKDSKARLEHHFPDWLDKQLSDITPWMLEKWKKAYTGSPSGCNRILTTLRGFFTKAVKAGLLDKSPMPEVKKVREDKNKKIRYLTTSEEQALLEALDRRQERMRAERLRYIQWCKERSKEAPAPLDGKYTDHLKPMVMLALYAGLRRGEVFNLKVADIDLPARILTVKGEGAKSGQTRQIPLNDNLFSMLVAWLNLTGNDDYVFPSPKTGGRFDNISSAWPQLCEDAGLKIRFHDLRHTFGTRLAHGRVDLVTIKEMMGHESLETTARYLHTNIERKREAVAILGAL